MNKWTILIIFDSNDLIESPKNITFVELICKERDTPSIHNFLSKTVIEWLVFLGLLFYAPYSGLVNIVFAKKKKSIDTI